MSTRLPENGYAFHEAMQLHPSVAPHLARLRRLQGKIGEAIANYQVWQLTEYDPSTPATLQTLVEQWERERDLIQDVYLTQIAVHEAGIAFARSLLPVGA